MAAVACSAAARPTTSAGPQGAPRPDDPPDRRRSSRRTAGRSLVVLVAILLTSLIGLINPILLKLLIDVAIPQKRFALLNLYVGLMIVLPIISGLIGVGQSYLNNVIGQSVMQDLRTALYTHLQAMPLRFFTETRTGEIQSRLANDVGGVQSVVTDTASSVTSNLAIAISTIIAMFFIDWRLTLLSARPAAVLHVPHLPGRQGPPRGLDRDPEVARRDDAPRPRRRCRSAACSCRRRSASSRPRSTKFRGLNAKLAALQIRQAMVGRWFFMIIGTIFSITPAFVYWLAGWLAIQNDPTAPTIGDIVAFTTLQSRLFFPLGQLLNVQVEIQGALALFDRIFEYLEMDPEIVDAPDAVELGAERRPRPGPLPRRVLPLPDAGGPVRAPAQRCAGRGARGGGCSGGGGARRHGGRRAAGRRRRDR